MTPKQFKAWRKARGWSLTETADVFGVGRSTITGWESGRYGISVIALRLIDALDKIAADKGRGR